MKAHDLYFLMAVCAACGSEIAGPDTPPASLSVVAGNAQTDTVARELASPIVVRVRDIAERPIKGALVNFVVTQGGGSVFAGSALTNDSGQAQERWTLGTVAGAHQIEARAVDPTTGEPIVYATATATALPGAPAKVMLEHDRGTYFIGYRLPLGPLTTAEDAYGNLTSKAGLTLQLEGQLLGNRDTVWAIDERQGRAIVIVAAARDTFDLAVLYDLGLATWSATYSCVEDGSGADSTRYELAADSVRYTVPTGFGGLNTAGWLYTRGRAITFPTGGPPDTVPTTVNRFWIQRPGTLESGGVATSNGQSPPTYTGGNWCASNADSFRAVVLTGSPP